MQPPHPDRASRVAPANPEPGPVSGLPRPTWTSLQIFPLLACFLVACIAGLMACHGAIALVLFGVEWCVARPEPARLDLLASRSGIAATGVLATSGLTAVAGLLATRRWDACRWKAALVATGAMACGGGVTLGLPTLP